MTRPPLITDTRPIPFDPADLDRLAKGTLRRMAARYDIAAAQRRERALSRLLCALACAGVVVALYLLTVRP